MSLEKQVSEKADKLLSEFDKLVDIKNSVIKLNNYDGIDILELYVNNKKKMTANYQILGKYDFQTSFFIWGRDMKFLDRLLTNSSKIIKKTSSDIKQYIIENKYTDVQYLELLLYYTSNNYFYVTFDNVKKICDYSIYITNSKGLVYNKISLSSENVITYYLITEILST